MKYYIGIDGGGTKTDYVLCDLSGNVINRIKSGGSNPADIGIDKAIELLGSCCEKLISNIDKNDVCALFAGLSGGGSEDVGGEINNGLRQYFNEKTLIDNNNDAYGAISSGIADGNGIVIISGTGSIGYGRKDGVYKRVGGWGHLIDKGGSGYDYGRDVIYHALRDIDGRGPHTILTEMVKNKLGSDIYSLQNAYTLGKPYIASFALMAFDAYRNNDEVAKIIMDDNAQELSVLFNTLGKYIGTEKVKAVLAGSIFKDFDITRPYLEKYLKYDFEYIKPTLPPVYGSCINAVVMSGEKIGKEFNENFNKGF